MDIKKILEETINNIYLIEQEDIPNIDLYMDQVTTFMERHLKDHKRNDEDKILTKTMINNYAKNDLLPSPEKKRYTKEHVLLLTLIYYFKNVMSINDIKKLLAPISDTYFQGANGKDLSYIYKELTDMETPLKEFAMNDMNEKLKAALDTYKGLTKKESDYLHTFAFVSLLSFDVYMKKQVIEAIIDLLDDPVSKEEKEKAAKKVAAEKARLEKNKVEKNKIEKNKEPKTNKEK
ncbi:MAG: DUF1836 domain-containing protein [Lachnospiraceae bacterium]|nr:DUF1836 domain-containing protein [Lachnospiraceae bacterium]